MKVSHGFTLSDLQSISPKAGLLSSNDFSTTSFFILISPYKIYNVISDASRTENPYGLQYRVIN